MFKEKINDFLSLCTQRNQSPYQVWYFDTLHLNFVKSGMSLDIVSIVFDIDNDPDLRILFDVDIGEVCVVNLHRFIDF